MPSIVVTAAGRVDHQQVLDLVTAAFGGPAHRRRAAGAAAAGDDGGRRPRPARSHRADPPAHRADPPAAGHRSAWAGWTSARYAAAVLDAAVGGGMSSRLFQEIREKRGLVYSVGSALTHYAGTGAFSVYAGCSPKRVPEVLRLVRGELARVAADGLTAEEVARGDGQLKGGLVLGLEDTGSRMSRLGKSELSYGEYLSVREVLGPARRGGRGAGAGAWPPTCSPGDSCLAVVGPYRESDLDRL